MVEPGRAEGSAATVDCLGRAVGPDRAAGAGSAAAGWSPWPHAVGWPQGAVRHLVCP